MKRIPLAAALFFSSLTACTGGEAATTAEERRRVQDSAAGTVALGLDERVPYRVIATPSTGSVTGTVSLQGAAPRDSMVATGKDARTCGDSAAVTQVDANGAFVGNALVWIDGIEAGKALPENRRETITIERCHFKPRVMGVVAGSTINVFSRDRIEHVTRFYREGAGEPVAYTQTVDDGQVVPSEKIAATPGIIEARCARHPWVRGYVAVFEHPYFAVTDKAGSFTIGGLPAGTYTMKVWHEGLDKPAEQSVVVGAGGAARLDVALALK